MLEQLTDQDAGFLYLETLETPMHVGGVSLVELPAGYTGDFFADYKRHIGQRLHLIPLMHRKLVSLPFDVDHPFWTEDQDVDLDYHIRLQTLPSPGRISQLEELVGRLHSNFLDRSRPLWEFYVIQGLENGQVAIYTKIHHAGMDGTASQQLVSTMYDPTPVPRQLPAPAPGRQADGSDASDDTLGVQKALRGIAEHVARQEIRALQFVPELLKAVTRVALPDAQTLKYDNALKPPPRPAKTLFNVAISSQRAFAARTLSLPRCKRIAKLADCKLNDVVMALCATALRQHLLERDGLPKEPLTAMVPVSLHEAGDGRSNHNTLMLCSLATDLADPLERLSAIRASSTEQKKLLGNIKNLLLPDLSLVGSGLVMRGLVDLYRRAKLADRLPPLANLTLSNVPGPPVPLYIAGARLLSFYPCNIPYHGQALNITVQSYCDSLDFGLVACRRTVPDVAELADHLPLALDELESAVQRSLAPPPAPVRKPPRRATRAARKTPATP
jgi:diacylglycerol O-acyltransferase / wax synthase